MPGSEMRFGVTSGLTSANAKGRGSRYRFPTWVGRHTGALEEGAAALVGVVVAVPGHVHAVPRELLLKCFLKDTSSKVKWSLTVPQNPCQMLAEFYDHV